MLYWRSTGIDVLVETDLAGNTTAEFIYFAGQRMAARDAAGQDYYIFTDHLGSSRVITNATGTVCGDEDYLPYGGEKVTATCWVSYKFTGYERDPETGLDYAIFRYYNSRLGRFMSPDPLAGGVGDPQSLNRYAYVLNDPVNLNDPLGLDPPTCGAPGVDPNGVCEPVPCPGCVWVEARVENDVNGNGASGGITAVTCNAGVGVFSRPVVGACGGGGGTFLRSFRDIFRGFLRDVPITVTVIVPFRNNIGPAFTAAYIPSSRTACFGGGAGFSKGRNISGGPLLHGNLANARSILSGPGISLGAQATRAIGYQAVVGLAVQPGSPNVLGGPTLGSPAPGVSGTATISGCAGIGPILDALGGTF